MSRRGILSLAAVLGIATSSAHAALATFEGGVAAETAWRAAAGAYVLESFDGYANDTAITQLAALHLTFDALAAGGQPGIYTHGVDNAPSGPKQIANFPGNSSITAPYQNGDVVARVDAGFDLYAFGFWNGDPQGAAVLRIYDRLDVPLGTVTAAVNTGTDPGGLSASFAGFVSTVPIGRLEFEGGTGDGWNHYDDFQAGFTNPVPVPPALWLLAGAVLGLSALAPRGARPR